MSAPEKMPEAVLASMTRRYPEFLKDLKWDGLNRCYFFIRAGMFHGVELDGHIHT
jgi:hypothetical protein